MQELPQNAFNDFDDPQIVWEIFGEILDVFDQHRFTAEEVASQTLCNKKLVNKVLHRLIQYKAVTCAGTDHWGVKTYRLNAAFTGL
jgi:transcription initiation factor IIE alpha subunit